MSIASCFIKLRNNPNLRRELKSELNDSFFISKLEDAYGVTFDQTSFNPRFLKEYEEKLSEISPEERARKEFEILREYAIDLNNEFNSLKKLVGADEYQIPNDGLSDGIGRIRIPNVNKKIDFDKFDKETNTILENLFSELFPDIQLVIADDIEFVDPESGIILNQTDYPVIPLQGNEKLYKKYNLLTLDGKIQKVNPNSEKTKKRLASLNQSPNFKFEARQVPDGSYRIFIISEGLFQIQNIFSQKDNEEKIIKGQAIIEDEKTRAGRVLINSAIQSQDTLPHEYAHHYIRWFKDTDIVKEGIKRFGSEEALVQAIGEQVVKQKGEAYNWWKRFTKFLLNLMSDKEILQVLTDSFLQNRNLIEDAFIQGKVTTKQDSLDNRLLDTELEIMNDPAILERMDKPLSSDPIKNWIKNNPQKTKTTRKVSKVFDNTFKEKYDQGKDGNTGIGIYATLSTLLSLTGTQEDIQYPYKQLDDLTLPFVDILAENMKLSNPLDRNGNLKVDNSSTILNASVDNEKEPLLGLVNLNEETFGVADQMVALGYTIDDILDFLNEESIKEFVSNIQFENVDNFIDRNALLENVFKKMNNGMSLNKLTSEVGLKNATKEQRLTYHFIKLDAKAQELRKLKSVINLDSKGLSNSLLEVQDKLDKYYEILDGDIGIENIETLLSNTILDPIFNYGLKQTQEIWQGLEYQYDSPLVTSAFDTIAQAMGLENSNKLEVSKKKMIFRELKNYIFTTELKGLFLDDSPYNERKRLLFGKDSLGNRIEEAKRKTDNIILKAITIDSGDTKDDAVFIRFNNSAFEGVDEQFFRDAFNELITEDIYNNIGIDIIKYSLLTNVNNTPQNLVKFIPIEYYIATGATKVLKAKDEFGKSLIFKKEADLIFVKQFFQNNPAQADKIINPDGLKKKDGSTLVKSILVSFDKNDYDTHSFKSYYDKKAKKWRLYQLDADNNKYQLINTLGNNRKGLQNREYNSKDIAGNMDSIYPKNNVEDKLEGLGFERVGFSSIDRVDNSRNMKRPSRAILLDESSYQNSINNLLQYGNPTEKQKSLLAVLSGFTNINPTIRFEDDPEGRGSFELISNTITLPTSVKDNIKLIDIFIEEGLHASTALTLDLYNNPNTRNQLSKEEIKFVEKIKGLRSAYLRGLIKKHPKKFEQYMEQKENDSLDATDNVMRMFYRAEDDKEFIAGLFLDEDIQKTLEDIPFDGKKSIIDRLIEIFKDFVQSFKNLLNVYDVKLNTEFEEGIKAAFGIIAAENKRDIQPKSNIESRESLREANEEIIDKLDEHKQLVSNRFKLNEVLDRNKSLEKWIDINGKLQAYPFSPYLIEDTARGGFYIELKDDIELTKSFSPKYKKDSNDLYLENLYDQLMFLENNINDTYLGEQTKEKRNRRLLIEKEAENLRQDIATFQENNAIKKIKVKRIGNTQLDRIDEIIKSDEVSAEELRYAGSILSIYSNLEELAFINRNKLDNEKYLNNEVVSDLIDLQSRSNEIYERWKTKSRKFVLDYLNEKANVNKSMIDLFGKDFSEEDINSLEGFTRDISNFGSPLLSLIDIVVKKNTSEAEFEQDKQIREIDEIVDAYLQTSFGKQHKYSKFFRKDGTLVGRTKQEFFDERGKIFTKLREAKERGENLDAIFQELREFNENNTTTVDIRKISEVDEDGYIRYKQDKVYEDQLIELLGSEERRDDAIESAIFKMDKYNRDRQDKIYSLEDRLTDENESELKEELKVWTYSHSPVEYLKNRKKIENGKTYYTNNGWKYLYSEPIEKWHDETFNEIDANPDARGFYKWFRRTLDTYYRIAPDHIYEELIQYNQIPIIPKDLLSSLLDSEGITGMGTTAFTKMLDFLGETKLDPKKELGSKQAIFENRFPFQRQEFPTPEEKQRRINESEKDLRNILVTVAKGSLLYKYVKTIEDPIKVAQKVFNEQSENIVGEETPKTENALSKKKSALDYYINTSIYGVNYVENAWNPVILSKERMRKLNPRDKQIIKELQKQVEELDNKELTPYEYNKRKKAIEAKINSIGDEVTSKQVAKAFLQYIQLKGMGFNVLSAVNNFLFGWISGAVHASGGEDYTEKDFRIASGKMLHSTANIMPGILIGGTLGTFIAPVVGTALGAGIGALVSGDKGKVGESVKIRNLMKRFNVLGDIIEINDRNRNYNTNERKLSKKFGAYELQRKSEYFAYGTIMVAKLINQKVVTEKEGEVSLYDVYDKNGDLNTEKYGKIQIVNKDGLLKDYETTDYLDLKLKIDQVNKIVHGNYDKKSPTKIKKTVLGRAISQFRGWLPEALATRFASIRRDEILDRNRSGRYTFMFNNDHIEKPWSLIAKSLLRVAYLQNSGLYNAKYLEEHEIANLRKNVAEMRFMLIMIALPLMLKWMDDDDEEKNMLYNFAINSMFKLQNDLNFYASPTSLINLEKNLIPALSIIPQGIRTTNQLMKLTFDEEADEKTEEAFYRNFIKMFPYGSSAYNVMSVSDKVYNSSN